VSIRDVFGGVQRLAVHTDEVLARLRATASDNAPEGCAVGKQAPEPVLQTESGLDDELG